MSIRITRYGATPKTWQTDIRYQTPDGQRHRDRVVLKNLTKAEALLWAEKRKAALLSPPPKPAPTFKQFAEKTLPSRWLATLAPSHRVKLESLLEKRLVPHFGRQRLSEITAGDVADYLVTVERQSGPSAKRNHRDALARIFSLAQQWGDASNVPDVPSLKRSPREAPPFLTHDECARLIASARDHEELTLVLFALDTGTRSGEQLALRWQDVEADRIHVRHSLVLGTIASGLKAPKSGKARTVALTQRLASALAKVKAERLSRGVSCAPDSYVFGFVPNVKALYKRVKRACARASVPHTSRHGMRHTHATLAAAAGVPLVDLKRQLGHSTIAMTERYAHALDEGTDRIRAVFDAQALPQAMPETLHVARTPAEANGGNRGNRGNQRAKPPEAPPPNGALTL